MDSKQACVTGRLNEATLCLCWDVNVLQTGATLLAAAGSPHSLGALVTLACWAAAFQLQCNIAGKQCVYVRMQCVYVGVSLQEAGSRGSCGPYQSGCSFLLIPFIVL